MNTHHHHQKEDTPIIIAENPENPETPIVIPDGDVETGEDVTEVTEGEEEEVDDINISDVMNIQGKAGITMLQLGDAFEEGGAVETVIGGVGEEFGGCVDAPSLDDEDSDDEDERTIRKRPNAMARQLRRRKRKKVTPFDEITGEISEAYLKAKPNTLKSRRVTIERERRFRNLMENISSLDQFVVESFVHTYHGYEIAKVWCMAHPDTPIEYMDDKGTMCRFDPSMREEDLPHWRFYCAFSPTFLGQADEQKKATEDPRIEGSLTRREREDRERKRPWYQNPNSLRPEDRICVLNILDKMVVKKYVEMMNDIQWLT